MKITGSATLGAPVETVWTALNDPAVLVRTIPGCERLETIGPDSYRLTITTGMAAVRGTYSGEVSLADQQPPGAFTLRASGSGGPGAISTDVRVTLTPAGDGSTQLSYDADAVVGGVIAGVGQRMLAGVAKRMAEQFFGSVDDVLTGRAGPAVGAVAAGAPGQAAQPGALAEGALAQQGALAPQGALAQQGALAPPGPAPAQPGVYLSPRAAARAGGGPGFAAGVLLGGAIALAGAVVGAAIAGAVLGRRQR
jgi:uncharacterized protein